MGTSLSTKKQIRREPPPLPLKELLSKVKLHMHPLNQHYLAPESRHLVPLVSRPSPQTVRMLTFNMCMVPVCFSPLVYAPYQAQRMQEFVLHYAQDYDVVCVQEVIGLLWEVKDEFLAAMRKAGFLFTADPKRPAIFSEQEVCEGGTVILSRFEIVDWEYMPFSYSIDAEGHSVLGSVYACVKIPEQANALESLYMHLFNVHTMSNSSFSDPFVVYESMVCRQQHITEVAAFVKAKLEQVRTCPKPGQLGFDRPENHLAIICGDFNVNALEESDDVKVMLLKAHPGNQRFIDASVHEYQQMVDKLSHGDSASLVDQSLAQFGSHPRTFIHLNTCRERNNLE